MRGSDAISMLKMPQNRVAITKAVLVTLVAVMTLAILSLWFYRVSFGIKISGALGRAAFVKPVAFTDADAMALLNPPKLVGADFMEMLKKEGFDSGMPKKTDGPTSATQLRNGMSLPGGMGRPPEMRLPMAAPAVRVPLSEEFATLISSHTLFGAPPKGGSPQAMVQGILGDQALINGQWMKVGDTQNGIKLVATMVGMVSVEIEGKKRDVSVWESLPSNPLPQGPFGSGMQPGMPSGGGSMSDRERIMMMRMQRNGRSGGSMGNSFQRSMNSRRGSGNPSMGQGAMPMPMPMPQSNGTNMMPGAAGGLQGMQGMPGNGNGGDAERERRRMMRRQGLSGGGANGQIPPEMMQELMRRRQARGMSGN